MSTQRGGVRVLLFLRASDPDDVRDRYHQISADLSGTAGLLRNELLRDTFDPARFIVLSEWEDRDAFGAWERGSSHRGTTAPLRDFQDASLERPFGIYEVTAAYGD
ncbi:MAG: hypothetical protein JWR37_6059 [Mycobacterium sp.]|nr:hypothetical protein [Mycobacterium sp.]